MKASTIQEIENTFKELINDDIKNIQSGVNNKKWNEVVDKATTLINHATLLNKIKEEDYADSWKSNPEPFH